MTDKEYDHKKAECWEEYWRTHKTYMHGDSAEIVLYETFTEAFDRAYTLGKQTQTITQEEIEKAAKKYAAEVDKNVRDLYGIENPPASLTFGECAAESFREGVKFALGKQEKDAVTNEEIEKLSFEFAEDKKWHDFNDLRSRARLLRQFITYVEKHTNLKIIQK